MLPLYFLAVLFVYISGSFYNVNNEWYKNLKKSKFTPPNIVFPIAWTFLYITIALSAGLYANEEVNNKRSIRNFNYIFFLQLFLNWLWSYLFFYKQNIKLAFYCLIALIISIILLIFMMKKYGLILLPYLGWCLFALYLNYYILMNN